MDLLRKKASGTWRISEAAVFGNKVCAFCVVDIGCINALPWASDLESYAEEPLFEDMETLRRRTAGRA